MSTLSLKQKQMLEEIEICNQDFEEMKKQYMEKVVDLNIPKMVSLTDKYITLNYEDYLRYCKSMRAQNLKNEYNLNPFMKAMEEISNNEILLYRHQLENILQSGIHALIQIQFLDSLVILRTEECNEKLVFNPELLENVTFLMKNLVKLFQIDPPTVANEYFEEERNRTTKRLNFKYKSPEAKNDIDMNIKLQSLSFSLARQHKCQIARNKSKYLLF